MTTFLSGHKFMLVCLYQSKPRLPNLALSHMMIHSRLLVINIGQFLFFKIHSCILSHLLVMICLLLITLLMFFRDLN